MSCRVSFPRQSGVPQGLLDGSEVPQFQNVSDDSTVKSFKVFYIGPIFSDQLLCEAPFPWQQRLHVALGQNASCKGWSLEEVTCSDSLPGAAKGLAHMVGSTPKTFHRDIKWDCPNWGLVAARCCSLTFNL